MFFNPRPASGPFDLALVAVASDGWIDCIGRDDGARVDASAVQQPGDSAGHLKGRPPIVSDSETVTLDASLLGSSRSVCAAAWLRRGMPSRGATTSRSIAARVVVASAICRSGLSGQRRIAH